MTLKDNGEFEVGTHHVKFNANNFASGVYFYRISAQSEGKTFVAPITTFVCGAAIAILTTQGKVYES